MKLWLAIFFAAVCVPSPDSKTAANVLQQQGIYIFVLCEPATEHTYLGTVKVKNAFWNGVAPEMLRLSIEKCKKDFPTANGLIFRSLEMNNADAVLIK